MYEKEWFHSWWIAPLFGLLYKSAHILQMRWLLHHSRALVFCWNRLSGCLRSLQGREGARETEKGRRESTALKFRWRQWNIAERGTSEIDLDMKSNGRERGRQRKRGRKWSLAEGISSKKLEKTRVTDKEPNNLCQDFYTFVSNGSNSLRRLRFPLQLQQATISYLCVCWTGSLPSQLCPCARAISPSLTFTAQLPTDRPPLHHFVWMSVPLSLFVGPLKKTRGEMCLLFSSFHRKAYKRSS